MRPGFIYFRTLAEKISMAYCNLFLELGPLECRPCLVNIPTQVEAQIFGEVQTLKFGFDVLDAPEIIPKSISAALGVTELDADFSKPRHSHLGIDFIDDSLLLSRHSTGLSRSSQIRTSLHQLTFSTIHNCNRDSDAKNLVHKNTSPCKLYAMMPGARGLTNTPRSLNKGSSAQTIQTQEGPSLLLLALNPQQAYARQSICLPGH
ncbi:Uncharacterized protein HZ326_0632 [Fusarium oxysporum f. sp. albedinis]|nr:Uncharacterized protein HZ326_0632 [Fusarium oxysporum f. sp. albedinis]